METTLIQKFNIRLRRVRKIDRCSILQLGLFHYEKRGLFFKIIYAFVTLLHVYAFKSLRELIFNRPADTHWTRVDLPDSL